MKTIFQGTYSGEGIIDIGRDIEECFDERMNPSIAGIPDEQGIHKGTFTVTITWTPDEDE